MQDTKKLRSYLVRSAELKWTHWQDSTVLYGKEDISSEEKEEITQLCRRIFEIEQEIHRLRLASVHLNDEAVFDLSFDELVSYGFDTGMEIE